MFCLEHEFFGELGRGRGVAGTEYRDLAAARSDLHVQVEVFQEERMARIACGEGEEEPVAAIAADHRGLLAITKGFQMDRALAGWLGKELTKTGRNQDRRRQDDRRRDEAMSTCRSHRQMHTFSRRSGMTTTR